LSLQAINSLLQGGSTIIQLHLPPPLGDDEIPPIPSPLERQTNRSWLHVDDLIHRPSLWIGSNVRIIVRRIEDSELCNLFVKVKMNDDGDITRDGDERVVRLDWKFDMTTGNICERNRYSRWLFNGHFRVRHVPCSRALIRSVVMLQILARRAKRRLLFRKWISTGMFRKFSWAPSGIVTSFLWESKAPMGVYVTLR
jgi:hypothetical protein|tara:strand:- start:1111 stop:1701 length:591 start_codon:yes stop_codon:yes gene_type:complete